MAVIGLTTSSPEGSVSVFRKGKYVTESFQSTLLNHSSLLFPAITKIMDLAELSFQELKTIVVDVGPGSFTGIRIASACAEAFAFSLGRPCKSLSSLDIIARHVADDIAGEDETSFLVAIDAGRQEFYLSRYHILCDGQVENLKPGALVSEQEVIDLSSDLPLYGYLHRRNMSFPGKDRMKIIFPQAESLIKASLRINKTCEAGVKPNYIRTPNVILKKSKKSKK